MAGLLRREDCLLLAIDAQDGFYGASRVDVDRVAFADALARTGWLVDVASALGVPMIATEEDAEQNGPTAPVVSRWLPPGAPVLPKAVFGAVDNPEIWAAIEATGRRTAVVCGLETDVCVAHSSLGLVDQGYRVVVAGDALYSPGGAHAFGLSRLLANGVESLSAKEIYYDWVRTLAEARRFTSEHPELATPPGFSL